MLRMVDLAGWPLGKIKVMALGEDCQRNLSGARRNFDL